MWRRILDLKITRLVALILGVFITIQTGRNLVNLWKARSRVIEAEQTLKKLELENKKLKEQEKELGTPEFAERQAREKLGLVKEGEVIFVLPPEEVKRLADSLREEYRRRDERPEQLANWQRWWKFFVD